MPYFILNYFIFYDKYLCKIYVKNKNNTLLFISVLGYDCPALKNIWQFSTYIAGASLTAAKSLTSMKYRYAINWCGGWHHAMRFKYSTMNYIFLYAFYKSK